MSIECGACGRKSQLWLCDQCERDLRDMLLGLPKWIEYLHDAAVGQTRLGESARRSPSDYSGPVPFNERASELYDNVHACLEQWVTVINCNYETLGAA